MTVKELNLTLPCTSDVPPYTNGLPWPNHGWFFNCELAENHLDSDSFNFSLCHVSGDAAQGHTCAVPLSGKLLFGSVSEVHIHRHFSRPCPTLSQYTVSPLYPQYTDAYQGEDLHLSRLFFT